MSLNERARDDMPALLRAHAPRPGPAGPDCLDDITIAAAAEGTLSPDARRAAHEHLAGCARCRGAVASVSRLIGDAAVVGEVATLDRRARPWRVPVGLAAAAALVLLFLWTRPADDRGSLHRAPTITAAPQPVPLVPVGVAADVAILYWAPVAGADRYRVTLFDSDGRVLFETQLQDTMAALPDSLTLVAGHTYLWKVEARTSWDRWSASPLVQFTVPGRPQ